MEAELDKRYQTMIVLWFALFMSTGMYFVFAGIAAPAFNLEPGFAPRSGLTLGLMALALFLVVASFFVKRKLLERSVEQQDVSLVQKALVVACALCEVSALLGLVERLLIGNRDYFLLFIFAAVGMALHFPRRLQLEAASYRNKPLID